MFDNILDVRFASADKDIIAVVQHDAESNTNIETYVQVDENDATYKALVEAGYSQEVVEERSVEARKEHMRNVYNMLRREHEGTYHQVIADLEAELELAKQEKLEEVREAIKSVSAKLADKRQQFIIAVAAIEALKKENHIKTIS